MSKIIYPDNISLRDWADNLVGDYPDDFLPILEGELGEEIWKPWGAIVASTGVFARAAIPAPFEMQDGVKKDNFSSWQEWARAVYAVVNNELIKE